MIGLRTLGAIEVRSADGEEIASLLAQPKRLALFVYLVLARPRGPHRRDSLVALFWPEQDAAHARNALNQAAHFLRRTLGADVVPRGRGDELCVRADALWCDAIDFERALDENRPGDALGLYHGPLLPGLHVGDASPELEQWLESERAHLARRWTEAVEHVATEREERGDASGAALWWRQLAAHDRFSSRIALRLMRALAAAGDPAAAVRHARAHEQLLRDELGAAPDPRIAAFVRSLRAEAVAEPPDPPAPGPRRSAVVSSPRAEPPASGLPSAEGGVAGRRPVAARWRGALGVVVVLALAGTAVAVSSHGSERRRSAHAFARDAAAASAPSSLAVRRGDSAAAELYVRARWAWRSRNPESIRQAILLYKEAIARDSGFALAWTGLADAYRFYGGLNFGPIHPYMDSARTAVSRALALDSSLSQAHTTLASLLSDAADWPAAEREYRRAIALDPHNALAHHWYAIVLATLDRREEAVAEIRRARALDSLSGPLNRALSQIEMWADVRDPTFATPEARPITDPAFKNDYADRARYHALEGECDEAAAEIRTAEGLSPNDAMIDAADVAVHMRCGDRAGARRVLQRMERRPDARLNTIYIAMAHTQLGEPDSAFAWLDREQYWGMVKRLELRTSIYLRPLRADPRYAELLSRVGMPR